MQAGVEQRSSSREIKGVLTFKGTVSEALSQIYKVVENANRAGRPITQDTGTATSSLVITRSKDNPDLIDDVYLIVKLSKDLPTVVLNPSDVSAAVKKSAATAGPLDFFWPADTPEDERDPPGKAVRDPQCSTTINPEGIAQTFGLLDDFFREVATWTKRFTGIEVPQPDNIIIQDEVCDREDGRQDRRLRKIPIGAVLSKIAAEDSIQAAAPQTSDRHDLTQSIQMSGRLQVPHSLRTEFFEFLNAASSGRRKEHGTYEDALVRVLKTEWERDPDGYVNLDDAEFGPDSDTRVMMGNKKFYAQSAIGPSLSQTCKTAMYTLGQVFASKNAGVKMAALRSMVTLAVLPAAVKAGIELNYRDFLEKEEGATIDAQAASERDGYVEPEGYLGLITNERLEDMIGTKRAGLTAANVVDQIDDVLADDMPVLSRFLIKDMRRVEAKVDGGNLHLADTVPSQHGMRPGEMNVYSRYMGFHMREWTAEARLDTNDPKHFDRWLFATETPLDDPSQCGYPKDGVSYSIRYKRFNGIELPVGVSRVLPLKLESGPDGQTKTFYLYLRYSYYAYDADGNAVNDDPKIFFRLYDSDDDRTCLKKGEVGVTDDDLASAVERANHVHVNRYPDGSRPRSVSALESAGGAQSLA